MTAVRASRLSASVFVGEAGDIGAHNRADAEMAESGGMALPKLLVIAAVVDGFHLAKCRSIYSVENVLSVGSEAGR